MLTLKICYLVCDVRRKNQTATFAHPLQAALPAAVTNKGRSLLG